MTSEWDVSSLGPALSGLRQRSAELADVPIHLHSREVQPADLGGGPRIAPGFWHRLTGSPRATSTIREEDPCWEHHPVNCDRCNGAGIRITHREAYLRPFALAFLRLLHARSRQRPHPATVISALLIEDGNIDRAAARLGVVIGSADQRRTEEARALSAIRALHGRFEDTVLG